MNRPLADQGAAASKSDDNTLWLSATGFGRFSRCEVRWLRHHTDGRQDEPPTAPMLLGTLVHRLVGAWWKAGDWGPELAAALAEWGASLPGRAGLDADDFEPPAYFRQATTIAQNYAAVYAGEREEWTDTWLEQAFEVPFYKGVGLRGYIDAVHVNRDGETWLREIKTMKSWQRMKQVPFDPQLHLYMRAWQQLTGSTPAGIIFDAISTYEYKTKRCAQDSFRQVVVPYDAPQVSNVMGAYVAMAHRVEGLLAGAQPVKALSDNCTWCPHYVGCAVPAAPAEG